MFTILDLHVCPPGDATSGPYRPRARHGLRFGGSFMEPGMLDVGLAGTPGFTKSNVFVLHTLQGINISHLGKRKIIFKMPFLGDMLVPWRVYYLAGT